MKISDIAPIGMLLVVAGIVIGIGSEINYDMKVNMIDTMTAENESNTFVNNTPKALTFTKHMAEIGTVSQVMNNTVVLANTSHTGDDNITWWTAETNGSVTIHMSSPDFDSTEWNVTYTYADVSGEYGALTNSTGGLNQLAQWLPTMALVFAAAIIIGIVMTSFTKGKE